MSPEDKGTVPDVPSAVDSIGQIGFRDAEDRYAPMSGIRKLDTSSLRNCCASCQQPGVGRSTCVVATVAIVLLLLTSFAVGLFVERLVGGSHFNKALGVHKEPLSFSHETAPPVAGLHCVPDGSARDDLPEIGPASYVRLSAENSVWPSAEMEYICESWRIIQWSFGQCGRIQHYRDLIDFAFVGSPCRNASVWKFATNSAQINCDEFSKAFFNMSSIAPTKYQVVCSADGDAAVLATDRLVKGAFCADLFASVNYFNESKCITDTAIQRFWNVSGADVHPCPNAFDALTTANTSYVLNQCSDFINRQNF